MVEATRSVVFVDHFNLKPVKHKGLVAVAAITVAFLYPVFQLMGSDKYQWMRSRIH